MRPRTIKWLTSSEERLTLKVLNFWKFTSYCSLKPLWSGMGEVVRARTSLSLHPPSPPTYCASIVTTSTVRVKKQKVIKPTIKQHNSNTFFGTPPNIYVLFVTRYAYLATTVLRVSKNLNAIVIILSPPCTCIGVLTVWVYVTNLLGPCTQSQSTWGLTPTTSHA